MPTTAIGLIGRLRSLSSAMLQQAMADWHQMTGLAIEVGDNKVQNLANRAAVAGNVTEGVVMVETRVEGRCEGPYFAMFPSLLAASAVGRFVMLPDEVVKAKAQSGLDAADLEAFRELGNLLCGSSNNALARIEPGLRLSQGVAHLKVHLIAPGAAGTVAVLPDVELACVATTVKVDGQPCTVRQLLPLALAREMLK